MCARDPELLSTHHHPEATCVKRVIEALKNQFDRHSGSPLARYHKESSQPNVSLATITAINTMYQLQTSEFSIIRSFRTQPSDIFHIQSPPRSSSHNLAARGTAAHIPASIPTSSAMPIEIHPLHRISPPSLARRLPPRFPSSFDAHTKRSI